MMLRAYCYYTLVALLTLRASASQAIEPRDYVRIHQIACLSNKTLASIAEQTLQRDQVEQHKWKENGCQREPQAWRWKYFDENEPPKARVLLHEQSIDQRLANIIYTTSSTKMFEIDGFRFNSGDPIEDMLNLELVSGSAQVDDTLCKHQLAEMLKQMDELKLVNGQIRNEGHRQAPRSIQERHIRLARVLDSFGRYEANHLSGRFISMGSYEQCQSSQLLVDSIKASASNKSSKVPATLINMRFCWARHKLDALLDDSLSQRQKTSFEPEANVLLSGVCLPAACHSKSFNKFARLFQRVVANEFRLPKSMYAHEELELESIFCLVDETSPLARVPLQGKLLLLALIAYLSLALCVTWRNARKRKLQEIKRQLEEATCAVACLKQAEHNFRGRNKRLSCWTALDLVESWRDFIETQPKKRPNLRELNLDSLNPIKVFGSAYVLYGHSVVFWSGFLMDEIAALQAYERSSAILLALAATNVVDTFFVITGMLTSFLTLKKLAKWRKSDATEAKYGAKREKVPPFGLVQSIKNNLAKWLFISASRYLRIVPMFALVHSLKRLILLYAGSGPMWDFGLNKETPMGACKREPWYLPLTPISAYYPLSKQCLLQSWSLSNDLFFSLCTPPIILLINHKPRLAIVFTLLVSLASVILGQIGLANVRPALVYELHAMRTYSFTRLVNEYSHLYTRPEHRIFATLIGLIGGYILFRHNQQRQRTSGGSQQQLGSSRGKLSQSSASMTSIFARQLEGMATWWAILIIIGVLLLNLYIQDFKKLLGPFYALTAPIWLNLSRFLWSLANLILFLRMITDWKDTPLVRFFSTRFWKVYSKLCLCILLIHLDLLGFVHLMSERTVTNSPLNAFIEAAGVYMLCLPISVFLFVAFENPISKLINSAIFKRIK